MERATKDAEGALMSPEYPVQQSRRRFIKSAAQVAVTAPAVVLLLDAAHAQNTNCGFVPSDRGLGADPVLDADNCV
jgi:hypothetical protein